MARSCGRLYGKDPVPFQDQQRYSECTRQQEKHPSVDGNPRRFPNVVMSSVETINKVDGRWQEYGLGEKIESPSRRYRKLWLSDKAEW